MANQNLRNIRLVLSAVASCGFCLALLSQESATSGKSFQTVHQGVAPHNSNNCVSCHEAPSLGGSSRATVIRAGIRSAGKYYGHGQTGVLHEFGERIDGVPTVTGLRVAINLLGDGLVEAIPDEELELLSSKQKSSTSGIIHGQCVRVTRTGKDRANIGRFGWKAQHATLLSAAGEALYSEIGIPNQIFPLDRPSMRSAGKVTSESTELDDMVRFLRSTLPVAPDPERSATASATAGSELFVKVGCATCHVQTLRTAPIGSKVGGGSVVVTQEVGEKEFHPYSDFLLHDVGTGDGIIQNVKPEDYDESTANKFRTAPLWGVRYRSWLMHDGKSITYHQAIMRHAGEALRVVEQYQQLKPTEKEQLRQFLDSL